MTAHKHMQHLRSESERLLAWQEFDETNSLDAQILRARKRMGPSRWAEVNRQWNDPNFIADRTGL